MSVMDLLDYSAQSNPSFTCSRCSGGSPAAAAVQSCTPCSDTPIGDILSEAWVSMEPGEVDPYETLVKIMSITKKNLNPDSKKHKDPQT